MRKNRCVNPRVWLSVLAVMACAGCASVPAIIDHPSANQDGRVRFLVLHFTDENFERSLDLLTNPHDNPVSAHYLVSRAGEYAGRAAPTVLRLVDESQRAWHAGPSRWQGHEPLNGESIGIEIVYESHCPRGPSGSGPGISPWDVDAMCPYPPYPSDQIGAVIGLVQGILKRHPQIEPTRVVGHSDIQPENKTDPGPRFPWRQLAAAGIGAWYDDADVAWYRGHLAASAAMAAQGPLNYAPVVPSLKTVQEALSAYGYGVEASGNADLRTREVLSAFQSHFLPQRRSGKADAQTVATLFALLWKYRPDELRALRARNAQVPPPPVSHQH
ncbi:MAG TPA: N-acetylmuramoyl-L-alanine amidase [Rudaea sp.]|jgi:N-acetylmuramoyl-L-alanine amidase